MKKVKTTIYMVLYSFLICMSMTMGIFATTLAEVNVYTNLFYYTKNAMMSKEKFQEAYLELNAKAAETEDPVITEIYFDSYDDSDRSTYTFGGYGGTSLQLNLLYKCDISQLQDESIFAYYYTYYNNERHSVAAAMLVLSTEKITFPANSSSMFNAEYVYGEMDGDTKISVLTKIEFNNVDTTPVTTCEAMFYHCTRLTELDLAQFDTSNVNSLREMFRGCRVLSRVDLSSFNTSRVTTMLYLFSNCASLTDVDLSSFNTEKVTVMTGMFSSCSSLLSLDLSSFTTSNVTQMDAMFSGCFKIKSIVGLNDFDTSKVTRFDWMFQACTKLESLDVSSFSTKNATSMTYMFRNCATLTTLDLSSFSNEKVTQMTDMLSGMLSLTSLNLNGFGTANVTTMEHLFKNNEKLTTLDLSTFDTSKVQDMHHMFAGCSALTKIYIGDKWTTSALAASEKCDISGFTHQVSGSTNMFFNCSSLPNWDINNGVADKTYAYAGLNVATGKYGYFTRKTSG